MQKRTKKITAAMSRADVGSYSATRDDLRPLKSSKLARVLAQNALCYMSKACVPLSKRQKGTTLSSQT